MSHPDPTQRLPSVLSRYMLLIALVLVMLPHFLPLPVWLSAVCVGVILWRVMREQRGWKLPPRWLLAVLTLIAVVTVARTYHSISGSEAGSALLTTLLCLKLLELRTVRDGMIAIFIGYFLVVSGFLQSQSIFMGLYLFAVVLALTATLITLNHPGATLAHARTHLRTAAMLLIQSVPLMIVLFILFPRLSGPLWNLPVGQQIGRTGLDDSLSFGSISRLVESEEVAFRVQFDDAIPAASDLYWRGPVLWHTDGRMWRPLIPAESRRISSTGGGFEPVGAPTYYTVTLEPHDRKWIFVLDLAAETPTLPLGVDSLPDYRYLSREKITDTIRYRLHSYTRYTTPPINQWSRKLTTALPRNLNPATRDLVQTWRSEGHDDQAMVQRALDYFRDQGFYYTRQPPLTPSSDAIDEFLFQTRRGFCEHFAASFVYMMRAADIPARIVTGYQGGEINPVGDYLVIRQSSAHAWAEVWLEQEGWVRVDPTSVVPLDRVEALSDATRFSSTAQAPLSERQMRWLAAAVRSFSNGWDAVNHGWNQWVLTFDAERQRELLAMLGAGRIDWRGMITLLFIIFALTFGLLGSWILWHRPQRREPAVRSYRRFCAKMARCNLPRHIAEGPRDFAQRVTAARPDLGDQVAAITAVYIALRYGSAPPDDSLARLRRAVWAFNPGRSG